MRTVLIALCVCLFLANAEASPRKRALLIGIDDYTASTLPGAQVNDRGWPDLRGAVHDVAILREMLVRVYGFAAQDIVVLTNQQATRAAILDALDRRLVQTAAKDDVILFYYAGHGSQVPNALSDEPDGMDESIVPADSRRGAPDIRDKELRSRFNRILDRGARLTLLLDHCHSGSGFRGRTSRGIRPAPPIRDAQAYGPRPEARGALVLAATQDLDRAFETPGEDGRMHGAFTWAWIQAVRDAVAGEPAQDTFLRAQSRLRVDRPDQAPAMLGSAAARRRPFLGTRIDRRGDRAVIAVERVDRDGTVVLQGGWANGLAVGAELNDRASRVRVTAMLGLGRSVARVTSGPAVRTGSLLEIVRWAAAPARPLRVWAPRDARDVVISGVVSVDDPQDADYLLVRRQHESAWQHARGGLPLQTEWTRSSAALRRSLATLRRIHAWNVLESPPNTRAPYRLALLREKTGELVDGGTVIGGETYSIVLRASQSPTEPRYYYVFVIDSHGGSHPVYPTAGSVENRFPVRGTPSEIHLGRASAFAIAPPYGVDTFFLVSTDEPLPNPSILGWDGVRALRMLAASRWSIERVRFASVAPTPDGPRRRRAPGVRDASRPR